MKNCCWSLSHFSVQKSTHGETSVCVKNISNLSAWMRFKKSIFSSSTKAFPVDNKFDCLHTQAICVSACMLSSFPHGLSNRRHFDGGDSTMINVLLSIFQSLCSYAIVSLFPLLLISQSMRENGGKHSFNFLPLPPCLLLEWMPHSPRGLAHMRTDMYLYVFPYLQKKCLIMSAGTEDAHPHIWFDAVNLWNDTVLLASCSQQPIAFPLLLWWPTVLTGFIYRSCDLKV